MTLPCTKTRIRRAFERIAPYYDQVKCIHQEIADRLLEQLGYLRIQPNTILELGTGTGYITRHLSLHYPQANILSIDCAYPMLKYAQNKQQHAKCGYCSNFNTRRDAREAEERSVYIIHEYRDKRATKSRFERRVVYLCADIESSLPCAPGSIDCIISGLTLPWCLDIEAVLTHMFHVLKPNGVFLFSTFGPDTLKQVRDSWAKIDHTQHVNHFMDLHDLGDHLLNMHFTDPVVQTEWLTLFYDDVQTLYGDLKQLGAINFSDSMRKSLTGKTRWQDFLKQYQSLADDRGKIPATLEIIYGYCHKPECYSDQESYKISPQSIRKIPTKRFALTPGRTQKDENFSKIE